MKTNCLTLLVFTALGFAALPTAGYAESTRPAAALLPPGNAKVTFTVSAGPAAPAAARADTASARWTDIKDNTYDTRAQFFAGFKRLEDKVDGQISELTAKRAAMKGTTSTTEWDFAMKEMGDARSYLKSTGEELSKTSAEMWDQQKEKVLQAWVRTQEAHARIKSSTTI